MIEKREFIYLDSEINEFREEYNINGSNKEVLGCVAEQLFPSFIDTNGNKRDCSVDSHSIVVIKRKGCPRKINK